MRTVFIAVALAGTSLTACSLYFSEHPTQIDGPDAGRSSDGGHSGYPDAAYWDADPPADGSAGCHDAGPDGGIVPPDAPCCGVPDASPKPDAHY